VNKTANIDVKDAVYLQLLTAKWHRHRWATTATSRDHRSPVRDTRPLRTALYWKMKMRSKHKNIVVHTMVRTVTDVYICEHDWCMQVW